MSLSAVSNEAEAEAEADRICWLKISSVDKGVTWRDIHEVWRSLRDLSYDEHVRHDSDMI